MVLSRLLTPVFILLILLNQLNSELTNAELVKHYKNIDKERNRVNYFQYIKIKTEIEQEWSSFPTKPSYLSLEHYVGKNYNCPIQINITVLNYVTPTVTLCLFKGEAESQLFGNNAKIYLENSVENVEDFYKNIPIVYGYVMDELDTSVHGYINDKKFYGTIQMFDPKFHYLIVYYIEPLINIHLYNTNQSAWYESPSDGNAILFEYVSHEDIAEGTTTPFNSTSHSHESAESSNLQFTRSNKKRSLSASDNKKYSGGSAFQKTRTADSTKSSRQGRSIFEKLFRKRRRTIGEPGRIYNVDNKISQAEDIIKVLPYASGNGALEIFDMREEGSYNCDLCIWIQPNFAEIFGYGAGLAPGTAEIIRLISNLNWIFRTIDFNGDGLQEKIGFSIKQISVTDSVKIGDLERSSKGFSERIYTIKPKDAYKAVFTQLRDLFKEECCARLGFVYHNMTPSISTTYQRGLCSDSNIALISGFLHAHKISLFDVQRALFHAVGHLFGAPHQNIFDLSCLDTSLNKFLDPFIMHPVHMINVGLRPNSMRFSRCSKLEISRFLTSNGAQCLKPLNVTYCGNGIQEANEECDCGNSVQCHFGEITDGFCCGPRDTFIACKKITPAMTGIYSLCSKSFQMSIESGLGGIRRESI